MTVITTTELRHRMAEIFDRVASGEKIIVRFGKKGDKQAVLSSDSRGKTNSNLPKNHSLLGFVNSEEYQNLPKNQFSNIKNLKEYHKEIFLKDGFENRYN